MSSAFDPAFALGTFAFETLFHPPASFVTHSQNSKYCTMQLRFAHFQVAMGAIISLTTTGVVYGWTGLREIFDDDLTYSELCGENEAAHVLSFKKEFCSLKFWMQLSCSARDMKLSTVYSVGSAGIYVSMLFLGTLLDRMGPKVNKLGSTNRLV